MNDWVLVDSLIWASLFSKPNSPEKRAVDDLIDADRVALIDPIVAEVLLGFRRKEQADWIASRMRRGGIGSPLPKSAETSPQPARQFRLPIWLLAQLRCELTFRSIRPTRISICCPT